MHRFPTRLTTPATQRVHALARSWFGLQPVSLATTPGRVLLPPGTEMFQFPGCPLPIGSADPTDRRVAPFGDEEITAWLRLPPPIAARLRPSSAGRAEASSDRASCLAWSLVPRQHNNFAAVRSVIHT